MRRFVLPGAVLLAVLPSTVGGQAPAGAEFQVNSYVTNAQLLPSVASDANGDFVVVWESEGQDGNGRGIFGRRFNAAGVPQGSEFQANTYTTGDQRFARVAADANGRFVVVWQSAGQDGADYGVFGQRFDAAGVRQGSEFQVNTYTTSYQRGPAVASDSSGNFVVVWQSAVQDGSGTGIFGQRFDATGAVQGGEFRVNAYTTGPQFVPAIAMDASGSFVVVWPSSDGSAYGIFGQRFDASGAALGAEFQVNSYTTGNQAPARVASAANGAFVVVWQDDGRDGSSFGVFGARFDASGAPQGAEFQVNTYTTGTQSGPAVASDANGNFVVAWNAYGQDGSYSAVYGQRFNASGTPRGSEFRINSYTTNTQSLPALAASPDGDFVVAWTSFQDASGYGIFGQRYGDLIFEDGFDSGDLSRWSSASTDGGDLSVSGAAALASTSFGLQAFVNDTNSLFVQDDSPNAESRYRARFYFDTNGFDPGEASSHFRTRLFIAQGSGLRLVTIVLKRQVGAYSIEARVRRNDGTRADTGFFPITDGPHFVEFDWQRSTAPGASDGSLQLWIDGGSVATMGGIDNDQILIDQARLGALAIKTGAGGTLFFDQFESRRAVFIGPE